MTLPRLNWTYDQTGPSEGRLRLAFGKRALWETEDEGGIEWSWDALLRQLSQIWVYINNEEQYPIAIGAVAPDERWWAAATRWENVTPERAELEREKLSVFDIHHDLAQGFQGIKLPSIFLLKMGTHFWISNRSIGTKLFPADYILSPLRDLGNRLCSQFESLHSRQMLEICRLWKSSQVTSVQMQARIASGFVEEDFLRYSNSFRSPDMRSLVLGTVAVSVAARMLPRSLTPEEKADIIEHAWHVPSMGKDKYDKINEMSNAIQSILGSMLSDRYQIPKTAYRAAGELRDRLGIADDQYFDPEDLLFRWGVSVVRVQVSESVGALACWDDQRMLISVLLNTKFPGHNHRNSPRLRATLAHEICHILLDRGNLLPVAEVLGGETPEFLEKRARAFAAELLCPRSFAGKVFLEIAEEMKIIADGDRDDFKACLTKGGAVLMKDMHISQEMALRQIQNSRVAEKYADIEFIDQAIRDLVAQQAERRDESG